MRLSIGHKIFLTVFGTIASLLAMVLVGGLLSMTWGFARHVREYDDSWLNRVGGVLTESYAAHGDWSEVPRQDFERWLQQRLWEGGTEVRERAGRPLRETFPFNPHGGPPGPPQTGIPKELLGRIGVLDAQQQPLAGDTQGQDRRPLVVEGQLIGYLCVEPFRLSLTQLPPFLKDQLARLLALGVVALGMSVLAASMLARNLRGPIRKLARATHRLATGDFGVRLEAGRGDELGELVGDFNRLAKALESQAQARRRWVADTSHELRTPLAVLRAEVEALQDGIHQADETTLGVLHTQVLALQKLVDDLHQLARSDEGLPAFDMTPVEVASLLESVAESFQERFRRADIATSVKRPEGEVWLLGDAGQLRRLFGNLLENSLRYTDAPGRLELECRVTEHRAQLIFQDSSPGVPPEELSRLFERFYRVEASRSRERGGSGLGLAICQSIVEAHQGTIVAQPSPLGGVRVVVELPCPKSR